jgi:SAM-dependent methyltransferase
MNEYQQQLIPMFEEYCRNKTVIEIGSCNGNITQPIAAAKPAYLTCVEPNKEMIEILRYQQRMFDYLLTHPEEDGTLQIEQNTVATKVDKIVNSTANDFYTNEQLADVVVCFGVLYHLHSPLHLLELIVNKSKPSTVILEPMHHWGASVQNSQIAPHHTTALVDTIFQGSWYGHERFNVPGSAQTDRNINNPLLMGLHGRATLFIEAMRLLGYSHVPYAVTVKKNDTLQHGIGATIGIFNLTD